MDRIKDRNPCVDKAHTRTEKNMAACTTHRGVLKHDGPWAGAVPSHYAPASPRPPSLGATASMSGVAPLLKGGSEGYCHWTWLDCCAKGRGQAIVF